MERKEVGNMEPRILDIKVFPNGDIVIKDGNDLYVTDQFKAPEVVPKIQMTDAQIGAIRYLHHIIP